MSQYHERHRPGQTLVQVVSIPDMVQRMTKPRGPLPELTQAQHRAFADTHPSLALALHANRRLLLLELTAAGWSHRMLAELYGVTHNTIRYWMRDPHPDKRRARRK